MSQDETPTEESTPVAVGTPDSEQPKVTIMDARFGLAIDFTEKPKTEEFCLILTKLFQNMAEGTLRPEVVNQALADAEANKIYRFAVEGVTAPDGVLDVRIALFKPEAPKSSIIKAPAGVLNLLSRRDRRQKEREARKK